MSSEPRTDYTRGELIAICKRAIVQESAWWDRDSAKSQMGIGSCWALLKAGCEFEIRVSGDPCSTDEDTIWIDLFPRGFQSFEVGRDDGRDTDRRMFYLPTPARLDRRKGKDWY